LWFSEFMRHKSVKSWFGLWLARLITILLTIQPHEKYFAMGMYCLEAEGQHLWCISKDHDIGLVNHIINSHTMH
jgi:hypothetical protein